MNETTIVYGCACGYRSLAPGMCRSHPYPCRAMGPEMRAVRIDAQPSDEAGRAELAALISAASGVTVDEAQLIIGSDDAGVRRMVSGILSGIRRDFKRPHSWPGPRSSQAPVDQ